MKKMIKRIFAIISSFIIGTQLRIFATEQTNVQNRPKKSIIAVPSAGTSLYGPPPDRSFGILGNAFSIGASILLFFIGLIVLLNKNIKKKIKIITITILLLVIIVLTLLRKFVFLRLI